MRDIAEEPLLAMNETGEPRCHSIDCLAEAAQFVSPLGLNLGIESAFSDQFRSGCHLGNGPSDPSDERQPKQDRDEQNSEAYPRPRDKIKKQTSSANRIGHRQKCGWDWPGPFRVFDRRMAFFLINALTSSADVVIRPSQLMKFA